MSEQDLKKSNVLNKCPIIIPSIDSRVQYIQSNQLYSIFHIIVSFFAIYLSFKCNAGFDLASFLLACICPYLYIIYKFATSANFCEIRNIK